MTDFVQFNFTVQNLFFEVAVLIKQLLAVKEPDLPR